ncbi:hypothetical protein [Shimia marina]|uniref:hypothetical protein n=1 Tax=Shimia marina TaxID=321267 RepID=UPI0008E51F2A|nr:hypothetical protein [Shimia marina]SFE30383.1 hypothetical protein SAMN04488037_107205 [Shimia marina]
MYRKQFLTFAAFIASTIGAIALFFPTFLLVDMKAAAPSETGIVMARTAGAFLLSIGVLNFLVRTDGSSKTLASILLATVVLQMLILPVDPIAYFAGVYGSVMSFVPNTILHFGLLAAFIHFWRATKVEVVGQ